MGRNQEKDAIEMAAKNQRILEKGFAIFAEKGIDNVTMTDVAKAAGIGIASLYRYYSTKPELVLAIGTWAWKGYFEEQIMKTEEAEPSIKCAAESVDLFLESFLDLYRNHKDLLRFNHFFNVYVLSGTVPSEKIRSYNTLVGALEERFAGIYRRGQEDGTLRSDVSEEVMFSTMMHLMLSAVSRYAAGLVYFNRETNEEEELKTQKQMLLSRFCTTKTDKTEEERA